MAKVANHLSIRKETQRRVLTVLTQQHSTDTGSTLLRQALDLGLLIMLALSPPDEHGRYDGMTGEHLAERLRSTMASVLNFLARYGHTPAVSGLAAAPGLPHQQPDDAAEADKDDTPY
jgi:hypothetical protein